MTHISVKKEYCITPNTLRFLHYFNPIEVNDLGKSWPEMVLIFTETLK